MAVLAGVSAVAPVPVVATPAPPTSPPQAGSTGVLSIGPGENLAQKAGVTVTDTEYQFALNVSVPVGYTAYGFSVTMVTEGGASVAEIPHVLFSDGVTNGQWQSPMQCIGLYDATNINWTPVSTTAVISVHVNRAAFDAARARLNSRIVISGYLETTSACGGVPTTSDDDK